MRSPKSVRRPHIRQQLTNRRKNLGRVAKSQRNQFRQWLLTAVLPNSINEKRQEAFVSLNLTEQPKQVEKVKKADKKKAQKQNAKDQEAEQKLQAEKAAQKEARRAEAEAKKRAAREEEDRRWKAEQQRIQEEQEKNEAALKKLQAEKKKEKAAKAEQAKKTEKSVSDPVKETEREEVAFTKIVKEQEAVPPPEPKTPTNTPAEPEEQVPEATKKKNKKNKKKSESETSAPATIEQIVNDHPAIDTEATQQQAVPQEKKNKKNSDSKGPAPAPSPIEQVVETTPAASENKKKNKKDKKKSESQKTGDESVEVTPDAQSSQKLSDDSVTAPVEVAPVESVQTETAPVETAPLEAAPVESNKEEAAPVDASPATNESAPASQKPTADSMDFLDFVTVKQDRSEEHDEVENVTVSSETVQLETVHPDNSSNEASSVDPIQTETAPAEVAPAIEQSVTVSQKPTADSLDFLEFVTTKEERLEEPSEVVSEANQSEKDQKEVAPVDAAPLETVQTETSPVKATSVEVVQAETAPVEAAPASQKPTADSMDFLDFVTVKEDRTEETDLAQEEAAPIDVQVAQSGQNDALPKGEKKSKETSKKTVERESQRPTADDSMDFLDFVSRKPEPEAVVQEKPAEVEVAQKVDEKKSKKNKKNKKNSESEKNEVPVIEAVSDPAAEPVIETEITEPIANGHGFTNSVSPKSAEQAEQQPEQPELEQPEQISVSGKPIADDLGFLDFVTPKAEQNIDSVSEVSANNNTVDNRAEEAVEAPVPVFEKSTVESIGPLDSVITKSEADSSTILTEKPATPNQSESIEDLEIVTYADVHSDEKVITPVHHSTPSPNTVLLSHKSKNSKKKHHKKNKNRSESEKSQEPSQEDLEFLEFLHSDQKEKIEEPAAPAVPVTQKPTADSMDFLDFVTAKTERSTEDTEEHIEESKIVVPLQAENESTGGKKKNKKNKNKTSSESEAQAPAAPAADPEPVKEATPEVVEEVFEKIIVMPNTETANAPAPASKKNKKNKKGSGNSESQDTAPAPKVEIPESIEGGKGSPGSDKENSVVVNGSNNKQASVEELDYGIPAQSTETTTDKKKKKKNAKGKNSNSISENAQVIAHLERDSLDQLADDEVEAITGGAGSHSPPIQVHEVTSTEQHTNGTTIEKNTTIEITQAIDGSNMNETQFQKNVQKLVQATLAKHDIVEIDPTVKMRIDAQLIKLSEKKAPAVVLEHVNYIKPLPMELHVSRPSTPSRDRVYKLLPKDIIFCAGLIDSHGENYAAMAADERNIFKDTTRALQRKIRIFKESPHYQTYLRAKKENRSIEEVIAAEAH